MILRGRVYAAIVVIVLAAVFGAGQDLPGNAKLVFVNAPVEVVNNGYRFRMYEIEVVNRAEFADELFAASPDLPPCGKNSNSSRTWINIYDEKGKRLYGWCAINSMEELSSLKFNIPAGDKQPKRIYMEFVDRRDGKMVKSNQAKVPSPGDLIPLNDQ